MALTRMLAMRYRVATPATAPLESLSGKGLGFVELAPVLLCYCTRHRDHDRRGGCYRGGNSTSLYR